MLLGFPVGYSIQIMLSVFSIATGIGWLHLAKKLKINKGDKISWVKIDKNKKKIIRYYHCLAK